MIKKLRIKFILISTLITTFVLFSIIGFINVHNYINVNNNADQVLNIIVDNDGKFPDHRPPGGGDMEMPFDTRYFVVKFIDGEIASIETDKIASINSNQAQQMALSVNNEKGYYNNFRYLVKTNGNNKIIVFVDCFRQLNTFYDFLRNSIVISLIGLSVVFILIVIFSYFIIKPVEVTYKKQKRFITDASHELKTPLTTINACCDILDYSLENNEWLTTIKEQTNRLSELTNKLVFLAKMDENSKIIMSDFSLSEIALESIKPYCILFKNKNIVFTYSIDEGITCKGDVALIKEMFITLLDNALKYSLSKVNLIIRKGKIILSNDAENLPQGNLNVLFERFYRLDKSRNSSSSHGIGLSICKAICDIHKWKINVKGNKNEIIFEINF